MTRFDEQPGIGLEAARLIAGLIVLSVGSWLGEEIGRTTQSPVLGAIIGFVTGVAVYLALWFGEVVETGDGRESMLWRLAKLALGIAVIGYLIVHTAQRLADGLDYQISPMIGFWISLILIGIIHIWRQKAFFNKQPSS